MKNKIINFLHKEKYFIIASIILGSIITFFVGSYQYADSTVEDMASKVIRFHVIANSDDPKDQELKSEVRDEILKVISPKLKDSKSLEESRKILNVNKEQMIEIAKRVVSKWNKDYAVTANLTNSFFPTKRYGDVVFPAGNYEAMKIVIGSGSGQNWWCVMFPPLCFVDITNGTISDEAKRDLEKVLSKNQYELVLAENNEEVPSIEFKFKIIEIWETFKENNKTKIATLKD